MLITQMVCFKTTKYDEYKYEPKIVKPYAEIVKDVNDLLHKSIQRTLD